MIRKGKFSQILMWVGLGNIIALAGLSVIGAFLGSERASTLFNSIPAAVYWMFLTALLVTGLAASKDTIRKPSLLGLHLGVLLIIAGGIGGSEAAHRLRGKYLDSRKIYKGYIAIGQGQVEHTVLDETGQNLGQLGFGIRLERFWIERYQPDEDHWLFYLGLEVPGQTELTIKEIDWQIGEMLTIPLTDIRMRVLKSDAPEPARTDRASLIKLEFILGQRVVPGLLRVEGDNEFEQLPLEFIFKDTEKWRQAGAPTLFVQRPIGQIKEYNAHLVVMKDGEEAAKKIVQVNEPLHYGGYHFYQNDYYQDKILLSVTSDSGLYLVYTGFVLLCGGAVWQFWIRPLLTMRKKIKGAWR